MLYSQWGNRRKQGHDRIVSLLDDQGALILDLPQLWPDEEFEVTVDGQQWRVDTTDTDFQVTLADGRVFTASSGDKKFTCAKKLDVQAGEPMTAVNEQKTDWVYLAADAEETKLGQFSGGNNGVRRAITEFEEGAGLDREEKIFLSLLTKRVLESKLNTSTWALTIGLLILTPLIVLLAL